MHSNQYNNSYCQKQQPEEPTAKENWSVFSILTCHVMLLDGSWYTMAMWFQSEKRQNETSTTCWYLFSFYYTKPTFGFLFCVSKFTTLSRILVSSANFDFFSLMLPWSIIQILNVGPPLQQKFVRYNESILASSCLCGPDTFHKHFPLTHVSEFMNWSNFHWLLFESDTNV